MTAAKRAYGSGSIREERPGVHVLRWYSPPDPVTGERRQRQETFRGTKKAAQERLGSLISTKRPTTSTTFGDLLTAWLDAARIADSTRQTYVSVLKHVPVAMLARPLSSIDSPSIAALRDHLVDTGVGAQTISKLNGALSAAFRHALEWGWVDRNPCRGVRMPTIKRRTYVIPTLEQLRTMQSLANAKPGSQGIWMRLVVVSGARRSEVRLRRWSDLHDDELEVPGTKSDASNRTIALDAETVRRLAAWRAMAAERAASVGATLYDDCYIISDDPACRIPWRPELATRRFARFAAAAGCPNARLHDSRHAQVTVLRDLGVSAKRVGKRVGHSKVATTDDVYHHAQPVDRDAAAQFSHALDGPPSATRRRVTIRRR